MTEALFGEHLSSFDPNISLERRTSPTREDDTLSIRKITTLFVADYDPYIESLSRYWQRFSPFLSREIISNDGQGQVVDIYYLCCRTDKP